MDPELLAELQKSFDQHNVATKATISALTADLATERKEREALEKKLNLSVTFGGGGLVGGVTPELVEARKAFNIFARKGIAAEELKTMSVGSDPDGGYIVLPAQSADWTKKLFDNSPMRRLARPITFGVGDAWEEPTDFGEPDASWAGENTPRTAGNTPQIGKLRIVAEEIFATQPVTQRLLDDSHVDVGAWLEGKIIDKFARKEGTAFISGTGVGQPRGIITYTNVSTSDATRAQGQLQYVPTGAAAGFAGANPGDALITLVYALRAPYRQNGNVGWLMNSTTASTVRKFKDGTGNYLWSDKIVAGQPPMLLGYPVEIAEDMPDINTNTYPIAFANWSLGYTVVDKAQGIRILRDPFTSKPNVVFYAYNRVGGGLANSEAIKLLKCAVS